MFCLIITDFDFLIKCVKQVVTCPTIGGVAITVDIQTCHIIVVIAQVLLVIMWSFYRFKLDALSTNCLSKTSDFNLHMLVVFL